MRINYLQWNIFQSSAHSRLILGESSSFKSSGESGPCRSTQSTVPLKENVFFFSLPSRAEEVANSSSKTVGWKDDASILTPGLCHPSCWLRDSSHERPADTWHQWLGLTYTWGNEAHALVRDCARLHTEMHLQTCRFIKQHLVSQLIQLIDRHRWK